MICSPQKIQHFLQKKIFKGKLDFSRKLECGTVLQGVSFNLNVTNLEEHSVEHSSDGACAAVHHPEHLPSLPGLVPAHSQAVKVIEQAEPQLLGCVLLHPAGHSLKY